MNYKSLLALFVTSIQFYSCHPLQSEEFEESFSSQIVFQTDDPSVFSDGRWNFVLENLSLDPSRRERHEKEAAPILKGKMTAFKAFQQGHDKVLAAFLKFENEDKMIRRIKEGPAPVNEETKTMALLLKELLINLDLVKFIKIEKEYFAVIKSENYDLKKLINFVNFNQITFSQPNLDTYHYLLAGGIFDEETQLPDVYGMPTNNDFIKADPEGSSKMLSLAEKEAINIYTGKAYSDMNSFLRGDLDELVAGHTPKEINKRIREILLHCAVAVSGLNKIPDFVPKPNPDGTIPKYLFRGESTVPESVFTKRKWSVEQGGEVTMECGFISTSYSQPNEYFFNEDSKSGIMFRNLKAKKVDQLSQYGAAAREVLLPPTHIQWLYHKDVLSDKKQKPIAIFLVKPVTAPLGTISPEGPKSSEAEYMVVVE